MRAVIALSSPDRGVAEGSAGSGGWARMTDRLRARAVVAELGRAEEVIYGRSSRRYDVARARGVQHALMWAQYAAATSPSRWQGPDR